MKLTIIIISWNTKELLAKCLDSIETHSPQQAYEIIVVDNGSHDGSPEMLTADYAHIKLIANKENVGFARANNQAIRMAQGEYVLLLNPDTEVREGALDVLIQFLDEHPRAGAAGARLFNPDGSLQHSCYPAPTLFNEWLHLFHLDRQRRGGMASWNTNQPREVEALLGACLMIRHDIIDAIGFLDEGFFMYSEEIDYCYRLRQAGWLLYWVPQAQVIHYGGQSTAQIAAEMFVQLYQNKLRYFRKHYGRASGWTYKFILMWAALLRLALSPLSWFESPGQRRQHKALAGRYWRLLTALPEL